MVNEPTIAKFTAESITFKSEAIIPSMLKDDEKALYFDVARGYKGKGQVIEIGTWLGSGTFQICRGLDVSGHKWNLTVIDRFRWNKLYKARYPEIGLEPGGEFLSLFRRYLSDYTDHITSIETELQDLPSVLPLNQRIELLFVDAPKSWAMLWSVLNHIGPQLSPGARIVFQDFFHVTSRQLIWLLALIPQLRLSAVVETGCSAMFVADGPIVNLEAIAPRRIESVNADVLLRIWQRIAKNLPCERLSGIAAGMAMDLLCKDAVSEAKAVLDESAVGTPWTSSLIVELERLIRHSDEKNRRPLLEVAAYLKAGIDPAEARAASARRLHEKSFRRRDPVFDAMSHRTAAQIGVALHAPTSATALTIRFATQNGLDKKDFKRHLSVFEAAVLSGALPWPREIADLLPGRRVVELDAGATLHGPVMRALGAASYHGVDSSHDSKKRTYSSSIPGIRLKARLTPSDVSRIIKAVDWVRDIAVLAPKSFDLVLARIRTGDTATLERIVDQARALAAIGATIWIRWYNTYSWSGHGRAPQFADEIEPSSPAHRAVLDWRHLRRILPGTPTLTQVRDIVETRLGPCQWTTEREEPEIVMRLRSKHLPSSLGLVAEDLITRWLTVTVRNRG